MATQSSENPSPQPQSLYCQDCGYLNPPGSLYCQQCGSRRLAPTPPTRISRPTGVTVLGILQILVSIIYIAAVGTIGSMLAPISAGISLLLVIPGVITLLIAIAFLTGKSWGRILMMIGGVLDLIDFPIGTIIGIVILWYLTRPRVKAYFNQHT